PFIQSLRMNRVFLTTASRWMIPSALAAGVAMQFQNLFSVVFTFSVTVDKTMVALLNVLYTLCSFGGLYLYRKYSAKERQWLIIGALLLGCGMLAALYPISVILIISNVL